MTPLDATKLREAFDLIRTHSAPLVHELLDTLERRILLTESLLGLQERIDAAVLGRLPDALRDDWSRKAPDAPPELRVVSSFACDPDESGGRQ